MTRDEALALSDAELARLFGEWSEEHYCAGWMTSSEGEFTADLLAGVLVPFCAPPPLTDYQVATLAEIRRLVREA